MKRMNASTAFMISLLLLIGVFLIGSISFFNGMNSSYIMIQKGMTPTRHVLNNYQFVQNKRGFIFSITFLTVGISFFIMIVLPSEEGKSARSISRTPQPLKAPREDSMISAVVEQSSVEPKRDDFPPGAAPPDRELSSAPPDIIEQVEEMDTDLFEEIKEGEDDVVYGSGAISDAAIIHFVHKYPDSSLKYLYRKQLDGKALTSVEEDIYQGWEQRHMTRGKVKGYIQTLMDWKEFPKKPLYEIWKDLRDHIFENVD